MLQIKGWSHALLDEGTLVGVARHVEDIEDYGPMGTVYFFGSSEPPEYTWLNTVETLPLSDADIFIVSEVEAELARNSASV
jgi:hypothetical protein